MTVLTWRRHPIRTIRAFRAGKQWIFPMGPVLVSFDYLHGRRLSVILRRRRRGAKPAGEAALPVRWIIKRHWTFGA